MFKTRFSKKVALLVLGDTTLFYAALSATLALRYFQEPDWPLIYAHLIPFSAAFLFWLMFFGAFGLYDLRFLKNSKGFLYRLVRAMATNTVVAILIFYLLPWAEIEPRRNLLLLALLATLFIFLWRYLFNLIIIRVTTSRVLFLGTTREAVELVDWLLKNPQVGYQPAAFMSPNGQPPASLLPLPHFSDVNDIQHIVRDFKIDTIVVLREIKENQILVKALFQVIPSGIAIVEFPAFFEMLTGKIPLSLIGEVWFLENLAVAKKNFYEFFKRLLDLVAAALISIPALIFFPALALAIKLDSEGSIFYRQRRIGKNRKEFMVFKYRTMVKDADKMSGFKVAGPAPRHSITK